MRKENLIEPSDALKWPEPVPFLSNHEELHEAIRRRHRRKRWQRFLQHPLRAFRNRVLAMNLPTFQPDFLAHSCWPKAVRRELRKLPDGFITSYSLQPDSARWLFELVWANPFRCIVECGCGVSTIILALAIGSRPTRFFSLEHDEEWMGITREALARLDLSDRVELIHAPLKPVRFGGVEWLAHEACACKECQADLLFIDVPPAPIGRTGVLPALASALASSAWIVLDDAARQTEAETVRSWERAHLATPLGFIPLGMGLAIMRRRDNQ